MSLIQIPGTTLVRDTNSMGLINRDKNGLDDYITKRKLMANQRQEINTVKEEIQSIKSDMQEIKQMLSQLMDKKING
jgi:ubiquinone biosynthesis protein UbiJ